MLVKFLFFLSLSFLIINSVQSQNICNFTASVQQELLWNGLHRNVSYQIKLENHSLHNKKKPVYFYDGCILAVQQLLPAGIYVDPDELEYLRRHDLLVAFPHNGINIEIAAPYAHPFNTYIFGVVKFNKVKTFLPVHARYQKPAKGGGMVENKITTAITYLRCPDSRLEDCDMPLKTKTYLCDKNPLPDEKCIWKQVPSESALKSNTSLIWKVPVGNLDHMCLVEAITMLSVVLGSLALMKAIHEHQMSYTQRRVV